jgi:hypothetical protein
MRKALVNRSRFPLVAALLVALAAAPISAQPFGEIPAGTRIAVELKKKLDARKVKPGKSFEARTVEALVASDGSVLRAGAKLKGRVWSADDDRLLLRFERIEDHGKKIPLVATVSRVIGERDVEAETGPEGEIRAEGHRGRNAAIGALVTGGLGAALGGAQAGRKGAAIGGGAGAATGAAIGAATGGGNLVLREGTRLELRLERPLRWL